MMLVLYIFGIGLGMRFFAFGCSDQQATANRIGCFRHGRIQDRMARKTIHSDEMTKCYCIDHCRVKGYIYAGLKRGDTCSCGMRYNQLKKKGSCTTQCTGDSTKKCGGNKRMEIYSTETIISDATVSYKDIKDVLNRDPVEVEDLDTIYTNTEGNWEHDAELGEVSAISLQIMSEESENTVFSMAVGYKEKEKNTTILVPSQDNGDDDSIINYMISGILHAVAYDSNGIVQKARLAFSMNTSKPTSIDNGEEMCAFLIDNGKWSTYGCTTTVGQLVNCTCNHTTSFAVLLQVKQTDISDIDAMVLSGLSIGGLTLSSICLIATIIVILSFSQLRKSERGILHLNLVVSLLAGQITFLLGIDKTENEKTCKFVAFLLHFTYLVVFAWMLLEAAYLYYKIIGRAVTPVGIKVRYTGTALAWGTPFIVAGLTLVVAKDGYIQTTSCWLSLENGVVWAINVPVIVILMINTIIMVLVVRVMWQRARTHDAANPNFKRLKVSARGAMILFPLLGLTWILGLFAMAGEAVIMQYMFVCFNSLQGAFIFINFCIVDKEVRTLLAGFFRKYVMKSKVDTTNSSATTSSSLNNKTQTTSHT